MSQVQKETTSLKIVNESLNETEALLIDIEKKLDYIVHGEQPKTNDQSLKSVEYSHGSLDAVSTKLYSIAILTSTIARLTNQITGN